MGLHDITLKFFCFLLCRIEELCPNHSGNSKSAAAFIRTQCLPEALKRLGFPNQKKQTQHLIKQLCWIHLSLCKNKTDFAKQLWSVFQPQSCCSFPTTIFNLNFGTYSHSLTIIISTIFKRLGLQINWYSHNELRHWEVWTGAQVSRKPFQCLHLQHVLVRGGWGKHLLFLKLKWISKRAKSDMMQNQCNTKGSSS